MYGCAARQGGAWVAAALLWTCVVAFLASIGLVGS